MRARGRRVSTRYSPALTGHAWGAEARFVAVWWLAALCAVALAGWAPEFGGGGHGSQKDGEGRTKAPGGVFVDVAVARWQSCGVRGSGQLACWGDVDPAPPGGRFSMVSASGDGRRLCAVGVDGAVVCWKPGEQGYERPEGQFEQVSADAECGVTIDGVLECWGVSAMAFEEPPAGRFVEVVGAATSDRDLAPVGPVCALDVGGVLACWGDPVNFGRSLVPEGRFTSVAANWVEACGLGVGGDVECWQLWGSGDSERGVSSRLAGGVSGDFVELRATYRRWCALAATGEMVCWGDDGEGEVGTRRGPFTQIRVDRFNNCGLRTSGQVSCWGRSHERPDHDQAGPQRWDSPEGVFTDFDIDGGIACGVREDTTLGCWGYEKTLDGDGNDTAADTGIGWVDLRPREAGFERVWVEWPSLCALRTGGAFQCWGDDAGPGPLAVAPVDDPGSMRLFVAIENGRYAGIGGYCALRADGAPYCTDPEIAASLPQGRFADISLDARCGVRLRGSIECWGYRDNYTSPPGTGPFTDVTLGERTACGIEFDSEVVCWDLATLELLDNAESGVPFAEGAARFADGRRSCAIGVGGSLIGDCDISQFGPYTGSAEARRAPSGTVIEAAFSHRHACAVLADGAGTCWGADFELREELPVLCYEVGDC